MTPTRALAAAGRQKSPRPLLGVVGEVGVLEQLRVQAQRCHLRGQVGDTRVAVAAPRGVAQGGGGGGGGRTWRRKVMGFCPMACASPMLALITSVKGLGTP